jgi:ADP-heptose:LPS heptosyltransferase
MRLSRVRWVDRYVGVPLCFVATLLLRPLRWLTAGARAKAAPRTLFIELSEMGSLILAYPALLEYARTHPDDELHFLVFAKNREGVELLGLFENANILTIRDSSAWAFMADVFRALAAFRRLRFRAVYDLELFSRATALLAAATLADMRVGFHPYTGEGLYRGRLLTHPVYYNPHVHMARNYRALMIAGERSPEQAPMVKEAVPMPAAVASPVTPSAEAVAAVRARFGGDRRILVVSPYAGSVLPLRNWPTEHYGEVVRRAIGELGLDVILVGFVDSRPVADAIIAAAGRSKHLLDLTGGTPSLRDLLDVIEAGDILLANDGGPAHFSSFTSTPALVFFGPETPDLYLPISGARALRLPLHCSPCLTAANHRDSVCRDNRCLKDLAPDVVLAEIRSMLAAAGGSGDTAPEQPGS